MAGWQQSSDTSPASRRRFVTATAVVVIAALGILQVLTWRPPWRTSADATLDWEGTAWRIVRVAGHDIPAHEQARLVFGFERIEVTLGCGVVVDSFVVEETTQEVSGMLGDEAVAAACAGPGTASPADLEQLTALNGAKRWWVGSDDRVTLEGGQHILVIERLPN